MTNIKLLHISATMRRFQGIFYTKSNRLQAQHAEKLLSRPNCHN